MPSATVALDDGLLFECGLISSVFKRMGRHRQDPCCLNVKSNDN